MSGNANAELTSQTDYTEHLLLRKVKYKNLNIDDNASYKKKTQIIVFAGNIKRFAKERRTEELDTKDIIASPSAAILHNAKLHKRFFIKPKWEIYRL